jgi:hypothetical protein
VGGDDILVSRDSPVIVVIGGSPGIVDHIGAFNDVGVV